VDFNDPERPRTEKTSARFLRQIIANNGFVEIPECPYYDVLRSAFGLSHMK
jgi:hypothetical protein